MLVDIEGLWFKVLAIRYGVEGRRLKQGGGVRSSWWREVSNGVNTLFWTDRWLGEIPLSERINKLYLLYDFKGKSMAEMLSLGWGEEGGAWKRKR